jgi:hypothetical protein
VIVLPAAKACEVAAAESAKTERVTERTEASLGRFQREKSNMRCLLT